MELVFYLFVFLIGACFGSFFNVVGLRTPINVSFLFNRSNCSKCHQILCWYELIPIVSFLIQFGTCRKCKQKIPFFYLMMEFITGLLFVWMYFHYSLTPELLSALLLVSVCMIVFITDITYMIIPNRIILFFLPLFIIFRIFYPLDHWYHSLIGFLTGLIIIGIVIFFSQGGMGGGDMKLLALFGVLLGFEKVIVTFFIAVFIGSVFGLWIIFWKGKTGKYKMPFAPFLVFAAIISNMYGDMLINKYVNLLGL